MNGYFNCVLSPQNEWIYTDITASENTKPFYRLLTGGQYRRFILTTPKFRCYWGKFLRTDNAYFAGIYLVKNPIDIANEYMPIAQISSMDIEDFKFKNPKNTIEYWANFYAHQLLNSQTGVLSQGQWKISHTNRCYYENFNNHDVGHFLYDDLLAMDFGQYSYHFDWDGFPFDSVIALKNLPDEYNGRVKWWRKKIKENSCPPLLFWWQQHCQSFLLIDGHARLKAHQLENKKPECLVLTAYQQINYDVNSPERIKERLKILQGFKKSLASGKRKIDTKDLNNLVLQMYDNYSYHRDTTPPKTIADLDDIFEQDLIALAKDTRFVDDKILKSLLKNH